MADGGAGAVTHAEQEIIDLFPWLVRYSQRKKSSKQLIYFRRTCI